MQPSKSSLEIIQLHPTFAAEVRGLDFSKEIPEDVFEELVGIIAKYGVVRFPQTGLDDAGHIAFASRFGELDDVTPYNKQGKPNRLAHDQLFDVSNLLEDGSIAPLDSHRSAMNKGNSLFHVDSSFNPRRAGLSLLRAAELPPAGMGGATEFADTRTAFSDLPEDVKKELWEKDYVACHSLYHSRKLAAPEALPGTNPAEYFMGRHRLVQKHETSGRWNLYIASHVHHIEGLSSEESEELVGRLYRHAGKGKYVVSVEWRDVGDLVVWDNTAVMHRSTGGGFEGVFRRDMRRATVHDGSSQAWGLNERSEERMGYP